MRELLECLLEISPSGRNLCGGNNEVYIWFNFWTQLRFSITVIHQKFLVLQIKRWRSGESARLLAPINVARVQILTSTPYVGWVCCWFSHLLWEVFLWLLRFSPLLKNQHFQIPIRLGIRPDEEPFCECATSKSFLLSFFFYLFFIYVLFKIWPSLIKIS